MGVLTFEQFLRSAAEKGEAVNILFEERLFGLVGVLHKIGEALEKDHIDYELIGGLAVFVHVDEVSPEHATLTRDVDLMVKREDLERIKDAGARNGFRFRHVRGVDMLLYGDTNSARNAIHLVFSGEKVSPNQTMENPPIAPERKPVLGGEAMVIPVADLVRMKLSAWRLKDQVHVQGMDAAGLITPEIETRLPPLLRERLQRVRETA